MDTLDPNSDTARARIGAHGTDHDILVAGAGPAGLAAALE